MITVNLVCLWLLTLAAEVFTAKSFIKPLIPLAGKIMVAKEVNKVCLIGAIFANFGWLIFLIYIITGIQNDILTIILYLLIMVGGLIYSFTLFKHYTNSIPHSILLVFFGGWMLLFGKKTKEVFGGYIHQMWDFEYQQPETAQDAQQYEEENMPNESATPEEDDISIADSPVDNSVDNIEEDEISSDDINKEIIEDEELNLDKGFDI